MLVDGEGEQLARERALLGAPLRAALRGVAVHVNAFNFPAWGLAEKAAVALLAGVPVVSEACDRDRAPRVSRAWRRS